MSDKRHIQLKFSCPPGCVCNSIQQREWHHKKCKTQSFINEMGDIFCQQHKDDKSCQPHFIKDTKFRCKLAKQGQTSYKYKTPADFLMAVALSLKAAQFSLSDQDLNEFSKNLTLSVAQRWYQ